MKVLAALLLCVALLSPQDIVFRRAPAAAGGGVTAPTVIDFQQSNWTDLTNDGATETVPSMTWLTGDVFVCIGATDDTGNTINTPTNAGLTFTSATSANGASNARAYAWKATAASGSSGTITATTAGLSDSAKGLACIQYRGSAGVGNVATPLEGGTTTTVSLVRGYANSAVVFAMVDWNAVNDVAVTGTPSTGAVQRIAQWVSSRDTAFVFSWGDQGAAGTTSYGITGFAGGDNVAIAVEVRGQ